MAQTTQIVPKYSFPYVETHVFDHTEVVDDVDNTDNSIKYVFAFTSSMGIDNKWVRKREYSDFVKTFGTSNYKKYGQPIMMPLAVLQQENTSCWCMRVMPENAEYANNNFSFYYKADTAEDYENASDRKFRIKHTQNSYTGIVKPADLKEKLDTFDGETVIRDGFPVYIDGEGYMQENCIVVRPNGRGIYGDNYRVRVTRNKYYEKDYGIKMYDFEILSTDNGLSKIATYTGSAVTSPKYNQATMINDLLEDTAAGVAPVDIFIDEDKLGIIYDAYIAFCKQQHQDLLEEYNRKLEEYEVPEGMLNGTEVITEEYADQIADLRNVRHLYNETADDELPDLDGFDPFFGTKVFVDEELPCMAFPTELTEDIDTEAEDYDANEFTSSENTVHFDSTKGVGMTGGNEGYFTSPRSQYDEETGIYTQWTYQDEVNNCYRKAYDGTFDPKILSCRRVPATAFFDANYDFSVKSTIADLVIQRFDAPFYLDVGVMESFSQHALQTMIDDYSVFDNYLISKNCQHYIVKEPSSKKRIAVTITYFLAQQFAYHMTYVGEHRPFVKDECQLTGHVRDTLTPTIEDYQKELKETLVQNRFNYFETLDENIFQRATQNTSQMKNTDLTEESNVLIVFTIKREIEKDIQRKLYDFAEEEIRQAFKAEEEAKYAPLIGTRVQSLSINFQANAWEAEHSIIHCYLDITLRGLQKRAILEININKREYSDTTDEEE